MLAIARLYMTSSQRGRIAGPRGVFYAHSRVLSVKGLASMETHGTGWLQGMQYGSVPLVGVLLR